MATSKKGVALARPDAAWYVIREAPPTSCRKPHSRRLPPHPLRPEPFYRVGASYEDFSQMSDAELIDLLERARSYTASPDVAGVVETGGEE